MQEKVENLQETKKNSAKILWRSTFLGKGTTTSGEADNYSQVRESTFSVWIGTAITLQNLTPYRLQFFEIDFQGGVNFLLYI